MSFAPFRQPYQCKIKIFIHNLKRVRASEGASFTIAKVSMTSAIDINVPKRALLAGEAKANLIIKRNLTSMFVNRYLPYYASTSE